MNGNTIRSCCTAVVGIASFVLPVFCLGASTAAVSRLTPDRFITMARKAYRESAYANGQGTLIDTNAIDSAAFNDRQRGLVSWVDAPNARNIRDIGGWTGLRTGRAFRGTQICDQKGRPLGLTAVGQRKLREDLCIRTDLDLRRPNEIDGQSVSPIGSNVNFVVASIEPYGKMFMTTNAYAKALRVFADARNYPVYFHCWGGADRTGMIAFLLEALCGVGMVDIEIDYELTSFAGSPRLRTADYFREAIDIVQKIEGDSLAEKASLFVRCHFGLTEDEVSRIRENLMGRQVDASRTQRGRTQRGQVPLGCNCSGTYQVRH